ncbi:hypothetical protein [Listeria aquatica]|uniref:hypothetical protein n=1 Tax=Listeria aquatica TaxID=1494960 RepID=UPI0031F4D2E7
MISDEELERLKLLKKYVDDGIELLIPISGKEQANKLDDLLSKVDEQEQFKYKCKALSSCISALAKLKI